MKRILTLLVVFAFGLSISAQSLLVTGDTLITGDPYLRLISYLNVKNLANKTIDVRCRMTPIINDTLTYLQFCWAGVCYPVGTLVSGQTASLDSGQLVMYPDLPAHSGYYDAYGLPGIAKAEYCFYDDANPTDETCFTVTFNATPTGVEDKFDAEDISNFYPNPSTDYTHFVYNSRERCTLEIVDILGNKLKTTQITDNGRQKIFIGDLSNGMYFGRFTTNNNLMAIKKLIIKR